MHDLVAYLANLFAHEHVKFQYVHQNEPDDSMFRAAITFQEAIDKIIDPELKSHLYLFQKNLKRRTLREREDKLRIKEDLEKQKREEEAREHATRFVVVVPTQPKNKGKGVLEGPSSPSLTTIEDMSEKGAEPKRNFKKVGSQLQTETELTELNPKRQKIVAVFEQAQLLEARTKEKLISSISIRKKEERLVQECSMSYTAVQEYYVQNVICLSLA